MNARRGWLSVALLVSVLLATAGTPVRPATAVASCEGEDCGAPSCSSWGDRVRPGIPRRLLVSCERASAVTVKQQPARGTVSDVSLESYGVRFTVLADEDATGSDSAVFEVTGPERSIDVRASWTLVPRSQNSPPTCTGDRRTERSDGTAPVELLLHPWCYDPDGDEFTVEGTGPGTHLEAPKAIPAGGAEENWRYRTATSSGTETATIWATDVLGARSEDAQLEVTVGPGVDRPPTCRPTSSGRIEDGVALIMARPGAIRRFGIVCQDEDADPFSSRLSSPPARGVLALVADASAGDSWYGQRWTDATYAPAGSGTDPDEFAVTATGVAGDGPPAKMAIATHTPPANSGGVCGWSGTRVTSGTAATLSAACGDDDGDPLSVEVLGRPRHGTAGPGAVVPGRYGQSEITVPYVPDPGYTGYDCVQILVSDGHGFSVRITLDITVEAQPDVPVTTPGPPEVTPIGEVDVVDPPVSLTPQRTVASTPAPTAATVQALARQALGGAPAKRLAAPRGTQIHAAPRLSRRELLRGGRAVGMVVSCPAGCTLRADVGLQTGPRPPARASRTRTAVVVAPGHAQPVSIRLGPADRERLRRARRPRASFRVDVRPETGKRRSLRRTIRIGA